MPKLLATLIILAAWPAIATAWTRPPAPVPAPVVVNGQCPDAPQFVACFRSSEWTVYTTVPDNVFAMSHEMGHAADVQGLDDAERERFRVLSGCVGEWQPAVEAATDPAECFADAYAWCVNGWYPGGEVRAMSGYQPTRKRHVRVCRFITHALGGSS